MTSMSRTDSAKNTSLLNLCCNTPVIKVQWVASPLLNVFLKLESHNLTGSVKDRAAFYIIPYLIENGVINKDTEIIESSSGNFAISLSYACNYYQMKFTCVIDPKILPINEKLLRLHKTTNIIKVKKPDESGGYLSSRLDVIKRLLVEKDNRYWINQYANPLVVQAYNKTLGEEIASNFDNLDYLFISVSSCGTIAGVSQRLKEKFKDVKVIAVDVEGSFSNIYPLKGRFLSGIGSSIVPENLHRAIIDDFQIVSEAESIEMCHFILTEYSYLIGGSSGAILTAINKYFERNEVVANRRVLAVFPDSGERYIDTIYNQDWLRKKYDKVFKS